MASLIWTIVVVLFVLWLLGFAVHIGGSLIHLLLVLATPRWYACKRRSALSRKASGLI